MLEKGKRVVALIKDVVIPALRPLKIPFSVDPDRENVVVLPVPWEEQSTDLGTVEIIADEHEQELTIRCVLCVVPLRRQAEAALLLSQQFNANRRFVRAFFENDLLVVQMDMELGFGGHLQGLCRLGVRRILATVLEERPRILALLNRPAQQSQLQREVTDILRSMEQ